MKEILKQYSTYNAWANQRLGKLILSLTQEQIEQNIESSFPSVLKTLLHMWDAESIWWQRREINEQIIKPSTASEYTVSEIIKGLFEQNNLWAEWVSQSTEAALVEAFTYENSKREQFRQPIFQC